MKLPTGDLQAIQDLYNNTPVEDFCGLTPNEMQRLVENPYGENCIMSIRLDIDPVVCDQIPFFRIAEDLARKVKTGGPIKLTSTGALPPALVKELYGKNYLKSESIEHGIVRLTREGDWNVLFSVHKTAVLAGVLRVSKKTLHVTRLGSRLLENGPRMEFLRILLEAYTQKFLWAYHDGFSSENVGQMGWAFSAYTMHKFGTEPRSIAFYGSLYDRAFPMHRREFTGHGFHTAEQDVISCHDIRFFRRFMKWFGFVTIDKADPRVFPSYPLTSPTDAFFKVFRFH